MTLRWVRAATHSDVPHLMAASIICHHQLKPSHQMVCTETRTPDSCNCCQQALYPPTTHHQP